MVLSDEISYANPYNIIDGPDVSLGHIQVNSAVSYLINGALTYKVAVINLAINLKINYDDIKLSINEE